MVKVEGGKSLQPPAQDNAQPHRGRDAAPLCLRRARSGAEGGLVHIPREHSRDQTYRTAALLHPSPTRPHTWQAG